jgi:recombination protein RecR
MDPVSKLIELFSEFPGIGPRQARRFAYFILTRPAGFLNEFTNNILAAKKSLRTCTSCQRFFTSASIQKTCPICSDDTRDKTSLMIVARDSDLDAIEKSGVYRGQYFVLGGIIPVLEKDPEKRVRLAELKSRLSGGRTSGEIILSMSVTPDGDHTADIVKEFIEKNAAGASTKITVLGKGLSTGIELEYSDTETLKNALKNRA